MKVQCNPTNKKSWPYQHVNENDPRVSSLIIFPFLHDLFQSVIASRHSDVI